MTDISKEAVDALIPLLNYGVCQDQYDDVEIYETEQLMKKAAQSLAALRAALDEALAVPTEEHLAFVLWKEEADRAAPNVGRNRTPEMFAGELDDTRDRWFGLARAALRAIGEPRNG